MYKFDANNQVVSANIVNGSVNSTIIVLAVVSFVALLILVAYRYSMGKFMPYLKYKQYMNRVRWVNISLGIFAVLTVIFGLVTLVMGSSDDDKTLSLLCYIASIVGVVIVIVMVFHVVDNSFGNDDHATFDNFAKNFKNSTGYELLPDDATRDSFTMNADADADSVAFSSSVYKGTHIVKCDFTNITNIKDKRNMKFIANCK